MSQIKSFSDGRDSPRSTGHMHEVGDPLLPLALLPGFLGWPCSRRRVEWGGPGAVRGSLAARGRWRSGFLRRETHSPRDSASGRTLRGAPRASVQGPGRPRPPPGRPRPNPPPPPPRLWDVFSSGPLGSSLSPIPLSEVGPLASQSLSAGDRGSFPVSCSWESPGPGKGFHYCSG